MSSARLHAPATGPAEVFAALGDPTRLSLLANLSDGEARSITKLSADTHLTRQAVTKHLHVLQQAGLVSRARIGRESRFAYEPAPVGTAKAYLDMVSAQWDDALSRLRRHVER
ncbi:MAG TPA: metalloregulator ArsR/SmtB family transcription factor [Stellaceae bacterium]|nr:metalloregulator ArsR/SmtB family transcription factor [Stellaceae bacterium]